MASCSLFVTVSHCFSSMYPRHMNFKGSSSVSWSVVLLYRKSNGERPNRQSHSTGVSSRAHRVDMAGHLLITSSVVLRGLDNAPGLPDSSVTGIGFGAETGWTSVGRIHAQIHGAARRSGRYIWDVRRPRVEEV